MIEIKKYFEDNKTNILDFIKEDNHIFPKLFVENIEDLHDKNFYENIKNKDNILKYLFTIEKIIIFNIVRVRDEFYFKSDLQYKNIYLFFTDNNDIYLNDKKIKTDVLLNTNSDDEIYIKKADFLIISYLEKNNFSFQDLLIKINEKNIFNKIKINKFNIKNIFLKNITFDDNILKNF